MWLKQEEEGRYKPRTVDSTAEERKSGPRRVLKVPSARSLLSSRAALAAPIPSSRTCYTRPTSRAWPEGSKDPTPLGESQKSRTVGHVSECVSEYVSSMFLCLDRIRGGHIWSRHELLACLPWIGLPQQ